MRSLLCVKTAQNREEQQAFPQVAACGCKCVFVQLAASYENLFSPSDSNSEGIGTLESITGIV